MGIIVTNLYKQENIGDNNAEGVVLYEAEKGNYLFRKLSGNVYTL